MRRGDLYRVRGGRADPKSSRVFVVVSREQLIESRYSSVICAPVYSNRHGIATEVDVGSEEGLKHASTVACDNLMSLPKSLLTDFVGTLAPAKLLELRSALRIALAVES
jgi:mRNA interferase MazF